MMIKALVTGYLDSDSSYVAARKIEDAIRTSGIKKSEIISVTSVANAYEGVEIVILYEKGDNND